MLDIVANYDRIQFQGRIMVQTQANGEKPHFGFDLGPLNPNLGRQFFVKTLALSVTGYHGQVSTCIISKKTNDTILRKFSDDGQTHRGTDRRKGRLTDERE